MRDDLPDDLPAEFMPGSADAPPLVLHQVRDFAAVLRREADGLHAAVGRLNAFAATIEWRSDSSRACLDELGVLSRRLIQHAVGYDAVAAVVLAHAEAAEAAAATVIRSLAVAAPPL